jgi:TolA-binding protein
MKKINHFFFLCILAALLVTSQAHAAILYGHDNINWENEFCSMCGRLYQIDTVAQTVTIVGDDVAREYSGPDIQISPDNSTMYMSQAGWQNYYKDIHPPLFLIDPATGENIGELTLSCFENLGLTYYNPDKAPSPTALEFVGGTLYASFYEASTGHLPHAGILGTIDLCTGIITKIGEMTGMNRPTGGLAYVARIMYAVSSTDNGDSSLFTVDLETGAATLVGNLTLGGVQQEAATALAYADGTMYTVLSYKADDTHLYSVDLSNGKLTEVFDLSGHDLGVVRMNSLTSSSMFTQAQLDQAVADAEADLNEQIAQKDQEIAGLNTQVTDLNEQIAQNVQTIDSQAMVIDSLVTSLLKKSNADANAANAVKILAQDAIDQAINEGGKAKEIEKALKEMAKAKKELDHTKKDDTPDPKYDKAIDHYKKAWEKAQKAMK